MSQSVVTNAMSGNHHDVSTDVQPLFTLTDLTNGGLDRMSELHYRGGHRTLPWTPNRQGPTRPTVNVCSLFVLFFSTYHRV